MTMLKGRVKKGLRIGKQLGYPTANLELEQGTVPAPGVYAARVLHNYRNYAAAAVIGTRYETDKPLFEVHLLDFEGDLYGEILEVEILEKVSEIGKLEHHLLIKKIEEDIRKVRAYLKETRKQ